MPQRVATSYTATMSQPKQVEFIVEDRHLKQSKNIDSEPS